MFYKKKYIYFIIFICFNSSSRTRVYCCRISVFLDVGIMAHGVEFQKNKLAMTLLSHSYPRQIVFQKFYLNITLKKYKKWMQFFLLSFSDCGVWKSHFHNRRYFLNAFTMGKTRGKTFGKHSKTLAGKKEMYLIKWCYLNE